MNWVLIGGNNLNKMLINDLWKKERTTNNKFKDIQIILREGLTQGRIHRGGWDASGIHPTCPSCIPPCPLHHLLCPYVKSLIITAMPFMHPPQCNIPNEGNFKLIILRRPYCPLIWKWPVREKRVHKTLSCEKISRKSSFPIPLDFGNFLYKQVPSYTSEM